MLKGGLMIDKAAHLVKDFKPNAGCVGVTEKDKYMAFYHEERLYSVRDNDTGIISLVKADSPYDAIDKICAYRANYYGMTIEAERRVMQNCRCIIADYVNNYVFGLDSGDYESWIEYFESHDIEVDPEKQPSDYLYEMSNEKLFMDLISWGTRRGGYTSAKEECRKIFKDTEVG